MILSDEEIEELWTSYDRKTYEVDDILHSVAKAQAKKMVEWGKEYCVCHPQELPNGSLYASLHRRQCDVCWQALLKEVE